MNKSFRRLSHWVARLYSGWRLIFLLRAATAFFWLFNFSSVSFSAPSLKNVSGQGLLDLLPFYSAQEASNIIDHYGEYGREQYRRFLAADFIFIPAYSFGFAFLFTRAVRARFGDDDTWLWLNLLPLLIGLFDCIENLCILAMLLMYPSSNWVMGTIAGMATMSKHVVTFISLSCLAVIGMSILLRRLNQHPGGNHHG